MKKNDNNLILLNMFFVVALVISNVVTAKLFVTGVTLFGNPVNLPGAVICYCATFLITDVIGEIWGKKEANKTVIFGLIGQVFATSLIVLTQYLPPADMQMQTVYEKLLGQNWIFVLASISGYIISQSWDVWIFHKIRDAQIAKNGSNKNRWLWNNISTMTSQILDTVVFIGIAFGLGFGWFFNSEMHGVLFSMMIGQYVFKLFLAIIDTPFFYLLTMNRKEKK